MSSLVLAFQRLIRVGNKGVSLYFGLPSTQGSLFCSKNERRYPFFTPQRSHLAVAAPRKHYKILSPQKFGPERRRMATPMPPPNPGESEPLTGRKISQRVISDTAGAFETGQKTLKSKNYRNGCD